jgi:hypothetical protein
MLRRVMLARLIGWIGYCAHEVPSLSGSTPFLPFTLSPLARSLQFVEHGKLGMNCAFAP